MYRSVRRRRSIARACMAAALVLVSLTVSACSGSVPKCTPGTGDCTSILFLGNSYTYVNDLPSTFARLADSGGHKTYTDMVANGGEALADHVQSQDSLGKIASQRWTYVVLQEQSQTPAMSGGRQQMAGAAQTLGQKIASVGAKPLLFLTAAHRDGMPEASLPTYESMQRAIDDTYLWVAAQLRQAVAPAGYVWFMVRQQHPEFELWQSDGSHPTTTGTYLEACVFYDSIFRQPSLGLDFKDGLSDDVARTLQSAADDNVLPDLHQWSLDS